MIKAPCVVKYRTFQDDNGYVGKTWFIEDAAGEPWADDACESDCREIAEALNNAARYRQALDKVRRIATISAGWPRALLADQICSAVSAALLLADAGKGGGE